MMLTRTSDFPVAAGPQTKDASRIQTTPCRDAGWISDGSACLDSTGRLFRITFAFSVESHAFILVRVHVMSGLMLSMCRLLRITLHSVLTRKDL